MTSSQIVDDACAIPVPSDATLQDIIQSRDIHQQSLPLANVECAGHCSFVMEVAHVQQQCNPVSKTAPIRDNNQTADHADTMGDRSDTQPTITDQGGQTLSSSLVQTAEADQGPDPDQPHCTEHTEKLSRACPDPKKSSAVCHHQSRQLLHIPIPTDNNIGEAEASPTPCHNNCDQEEPQKVYQSLSPHTRFSFPQPQAENTPDLDSSQQATHNPMVNTAGDTKHCRGESFSSSSSFSCQTAQSFSDSAIKSDSVNTEVTTPDSPTQEANQDSACGHASFAHCDNSLTCLADDNANLGAAKTPQVISSSPSHPMSTEQKPQHEPIATSQTQGKLFGLWTAMKNIRRPSQSTSAVSPVLDTSCAAEATSCAQQSEAATHLPRRDDHSRARFCEQDDLKTQIEQLNDTTISDPKARQLQRQSIRNSLVNALQDKNDDYNWDFWADALCGFEGTRSPEMTLQIRRGIPPSIRGLVWRLLAESSKHEHHERYLQLLKGPSAYDKLIQRDLARTFPGHSFFKDRNGAGQEGLYNVVRAYSVFDQKVGYCQGLAFIVGPLLLHMPEDEAFGVLVQLMQKYGFRGHYTPDMEGLHLRLYQFDSLVANHLPHVARHLEKQGVGSTMYASQWFMTLFAYKFPLNLVVRVYDIIFSEGSCAIFKFALALLKRGETTILGLDFEHLLDYLKNGLFENYKDDEQSLVAEASKLDITVRHLTLLEKEHKTRTARTMANAKIINELQRDQAELRQRSQALEETTIRTLREREAVSAQLAQARIHRNHIQTEHASLKDLVEMLKAQIQTLPNRYETPCRDRFEHLCTENAVLVQKNSSLEDELMQLEITLIDLKMRYAHTENERDQLQKRLNEMKKVIRV